MRLPYLVVFLSALTSLFASTIFDHHLLAHEKPIERNNYVFSLLRMPDKKYDIFGLKLPHRTHASFGKKQIITTDGMVPVAQVTSEEQVKGLDVHCRVFVNGLNAQSMYLIDGVPGEHIFILERIRIEKQSGIIGNSQLHCYTYCPAGETYILYPDQVEQFKSKTAELGVKHILVENYQNCWKDMDATSDTIPGGSTSDPASPPEITPSGQGDTSDAAPSRAANIVVAVLKYFGI